MSTTAHFVPHDTGAVDADNPWPGLAPFREDDRAFFRGRESEIEELHRLVRRERLTVVFGHSGLGKSSLLQAGLFPRLRDDEGALPVYIRLDHSQSGAPLRDQVESAIFTHARAAEVEPPEPRNGETLWEYFHRGDAVFWNRRNRPVLPVLVFDQFEEIFTLGKDSPERAAASRRLLVELGDFIEGRPPASLAARLEEDASEAARFTFSRHHYKVLLTLREDFLAELEALRDRIPSIGHNRMRLRRMTGEQARDVVGQTAGRLVAEAAVEPIVRFVAGSVADGKPLGEVAVDPALLSVFCRELNNRRIQLGEARITTALLEGSRAEILTAFYERSLADQPGEVRTFIEERLLTVSGFRDSVALENALTTPGVTAAAIRTLVDRRLLRLDDLAGLRRLELAHDVLTDVVRSSRDTRRAGEERAAAEEARLAAEEREGRMRAELRRSRRVSALLAVLALLAIGSAVWGFVSQSRAERARADAESARHSTARALADAVDARQQSDRDRAVAERARRDTEVALAAAQSAQSEAEQATMAAEASFRFALDATDNLALQVVRELETNFDVPTREKIYIAERLDANFSDLIGRVGATADLESRYADLLTSIGFTFFNVGRYDLARGRVERANALLFSRRSTDTPTPASLLLRSRARLALAQAHTYSMAFARAEAALDEADRLLRSALAGAAAATPDVTVLRARLLAARAQLQAAHYRYAEAAAAETEARSAAVQGLERISRGDQRARRELFSVLFEMHALRDLMASVSGSGGRDVILADLRGDLDLAKRDFASGTDPVWRFHQAVSSSLEADHHGDAGRTGQAVEVASGAVAQLHELVVGDYGNLVWRSRLANELASRSHHARGRRDYPQAEVDLIAAKTLAVSLKRDSPNAFLVSRVDVLSDYQEGRLHLARGKWDDALRVFGRLQARADYRRDVFTEPHRLNDATFLAQLGMAEAHLAKKSYPEALRAAHKAVAAIEQNEALAGAGLYSTSRRYFIRSALLGVDQTSVFVEEWAELVRDALKAADQMIAWHPESTSWRSRRAYVLSREAVRLTSERRRSEAAEMLRRALDEQLAAKELAPQDLWNTLNVIYYAGERVRSLAALDDWRGVLATADLARREVPQDVGEWGESARLQSQWASFVSTLERSVKTAQTKGGDVDAELLQRLQRELRLAVDLKGELDRRASATLTARGGAAGAAGLDPRSLDLSAVTARRDGNVREVTTRLGFASRPQYQGIWRTLIDEELDEAIRWFVRTEPLRESARERIERVRRLRLPFYDDGVLLEAEYTAAEGVFIVAILVIDDDDRPYPLNGTSPPIHEANAAAPLRLRSASDAASYLRFFGAYVAGDEGPFQIVEAAQDLSWASDATGEQRQAVSRLLRPLIVWANPERDGWWQASGTVQYGNAVFHALFDVQPTGMIEMREDAQVARNLPLEPPLFSRAGRLDRVVQRLDLSAFGLEPVTDEVAALERLASLPEAERPDHYAQLAAEAAALKGRAQPLGAGPLEGDAGDPTVRRDGSRIADNLFGRVDFLLGKDQSIVIVVPVVLPERELYLWVQPTHLTFATADEILADIAYQGGEVYDRLRKLDRVGIVEFAPGTEMPRVITKVMTVRLGFPKQLR